MLNCPKCCICQHTGYGIHPKCSKPKTADFLFNFALASWDFLLCPVMNTQFHADWGNWSKGLLFILYTFYRALLSSLWGARVGRQPIYITLQVFGQAEASIPKVPKKSFCFWETKLNGDKRSKQWEAASWAQKWHFSNGACIFRRAGEVGVVLCGKWQMQKEQQKQQREMKQAWPWSPGAAAWWRPPRSPPGPACSDPPRRLPASLAVRPPACRSRPLAQRRPGSAPDALGRVRSAATHMALVIFMCWFDCKCLFILPFHSICTFFFSISWIFFLLTLLPWIWSNNLSMKILYKKCVGKLLFFWCDNFVSNFVKYNFIQLIHYQRLFTLQPFNPRYVFFPNFSRTTLSRIGWYWIS